MQPEIVLLYAFMCLTKCQNSTAMAVYTTPAPTKIGLSVASPTDRITIAIGMVMPKTNFSVDMN